MKYQYTREHMVPAVMEVTHDELRTIQKMVRHMLALETMPEGLYKCDLRGIEQGVTEALENITLALHYAFPRPEDN